MSLVTKAAPDFTKAAVMPDGSINDAFNLASYIKGKNAVVFFYPLDFTFVCPSEIWPTPSAPANSPSATRW